MEHESKWHIFGPYCPFCNSLLNSLQVAPIGHHWRARSGHEDAGKSGEWLEARRATGIREVADEPELR